MRRIFPGLYTFTGLMAGRAYLVQDPDGFTLIDAGLEPAAGKIVEQLRAVGHRPTDIKRILITHAHPDHVGGLPRLRTLTGAKVYASTVEREVVEGNAPVPRPRPEDLHGIWKRVQMPQTTFSPTPVDRTLSDGEVLPEVMGGLQVVSTPGHTNGHIAFWQPERRVLFCGDVVMLLFGLRLPFPPATVDMAEDIRSVARVAALEPEIICFGHGVPLKKDAAGMLKRFSEKVSRG